MFFKLQKNLIKQLNHSQKKLISRLYHIFINVVIKDINQQVLLILVTLIKVKNIKKHY
jgi:hypothetical protein